MTSKSYQDVRVGTRKEESLETLSEDREWLCRCDVERTVVTHVGTTALAAGNARFPTVESRTGGPDLSISGLLMQLVLCVCVLTYQRGDHDWRWSDWCRHLRQPDEWVHVDDIDDTVTRLELCSICCSHSKSVASISCLVVTRSRHMKVTSFCYHLYRHLLLHLHPHPTFMTSCE